MAIHIEEIMNREVYSAKLDDAVRDVRQALIHLGVSGAPVVDDLGRPLGVVSLKDISGVADAGLVGDYISYPAVAVHPTTPIRAAAYLMAQTQCHRLIVVDENIAVGVVGTLDVIRALIGVPAAHPATFPHYDAETGVTWSDDYLLDGNHVEAAPQAPGVLLIIDGGVDRPETILWGECSDDLRGRLLEYLEEPAGGSGMIAYWKGKAALRFRVATIPDPVERVRVLDRALPR